MKLQEKASCLFDFMDRHYIRPTLIWKLKPCFATHFATAPARRACLARQARRAIRGKQKIYKISSTC